MDRVLLERTVNWPVRGALPEEQTRYADQGARVAIDSRPFSRGGRG